MNYYFQWPLITKTGGPLRNQNDKTMRYFISLFVCALGLVAQLAAQQPKPLSGAFLLTSTDLDSVRMTPRITPRDTVLNSFLRWSGTVATLSPTGRITESALVLSLAQNSELTANQSFNYTEAYVSALVHYRTVLTDRSISSITEQRIRLHIDNSTAPGAKPYAKDSWVMPNVVWADILVDTFRCSIPVNDPQNALQNDIFIFTAQILGDQYKLMPNPPTAPGIAQVRISENGGIANISWNAVDWAESYDLEWTVVDNYGRTTAEVDYTFRNNATRVNVLNNSYDVPVVFPEGIVVFRARSIGRLDDSTRMAGPWTRAEKGRIPTTSTTITNSDRLYVKGALIHEGGKKNWQYVAAFAEEGMRKDVVTYHDGALNNRQTVTQLNTNANYLVVQETYYDHLGRPVVTAMPAPLKPSPESEALPPDISLVGTISPGNLTPYTPTAHGTPKPPTRKKGKADPFSTQAHIGTGAGASAVGAGTTSWSMANLTEILNNPWAAGNWPLWSTIEKYYTDKPALRYQPRFNLNTTKSTLFRKRSGTK